MATYLFNGGEYNRCAEARRGSVRYEFGDFVTMVHFSTYEANGLPITDTYFTLHQNSKLIAEKKTRGVPSYITFTAWLALNTPSAPA